MCTAASRNPTNAVLEERIAALEGGAGAIATASGQAALHLAIATLAGAGSHIVSSSALYGGSHNLLSYTLPRFGIETTFVKPNDIDAWRAAIRAEHQAAVRRDARQPRARRARRPHARVARPRACAAVDGRFDVHDALPDAPVRARRRPHLSLGHQVPERARHHHRRRARRQRHVRLGSGSCALGPLRRAHATLRRLSRHGVLRGEHRRRVPAARAPRRPARLRRVHEPAHRVARAAGHRDAVAAHAAPREQHAQGRRVPQPTRDGRTRSRTPSWNRMPAMRSRSGCCRAAADRCSASS